VTSDEGDPVKAHITTLPGDGIGPEVVAVGVRVLEEVADRYGHAFTFEEAPIGGSAIEATGDPRRRRRWRLAAAPTRC
jgi:3-isopropylmalate dehydrogenase